MSPCSLFLGRTLRTRLDRLRPDVGARIVLYQDKQKAHHDRHSKYRELKIRQPVWARNIREGPRWVQGIVADRVGPLSYLIKLPDGDLWRRHIDYLQEGDMVVQSPLHGDDLPIPPDPESHTAEVAMQSCPSHLAQVPTATAGAIQSSSNDSQISTDSPASSNLQDSQPVPERRYPSRDRRPSDRYTVNWN